MQHWLICVKKCTSSLKLYLASENLFSHFSSIIYLLFTFIYCCFTQHCIFWKTITQCVQVCSEYIILWVVFQNNDAARKVTRDYMFQQSWQILLLWASSRECLHDINATENPKSISLLVLNMAWIEPWKGRGGCSIYQNCGWLTTTEDDECPPPLLTSSRPLASVVARPTTDTPTTTAPHCNSGSTSNTELNTRSAHVSRNWKAAKTGTKATNRDTNEILNPLLTIQKDFWS